jgi:hypothetical protein
MRNKIERVSFFFMMSDLQSERVVKKCSIGIDGRRGGKVPLGRWS